MTKSAFCQRNLAGYFALLALLIGATVTAAIAKGTFGWADVVEPEKVAKDASASPGATRGAAAAEGGQQARGSTASSPTVDVVTMATPNGGIKLIAQPPTVGPGDRSQLVFNTVSSLVLPSVVAIHIAQGPPSGPVTWKSVGSGFVVDSRGYILTTHHVVARNAPLSVNVSGRGGGDFRAEIVAGDAQADLALLRILDPPPLREVRLGDSHAVLPGDWVLAFGSPFGLDQTVTQGIVSNRWSPLVVAGVSYGELLQTDAPINPGSSGGPLVDLNAQVVGINTAIYGINSGFSGTGFAIPIERAQAFLASNQAVFEQ